MAKRQPIPYYPPAPEPWLETLAWLMDRSIRIGPWSIGLDGIIGLVPGVGDIAGSLISSVIVLAAINAGVSKASVFRMIANVATDCIVGAIPFVGDFFDFAFKANSKNIIIFRESLSGERRIGRDWGFLVVAIVILLAVMVLPLISFIYVVQRILVR